MGNTQPASNQYFFPKVSCGTDLLDVSNREAHIGGKVGRVEREYEAQTIEQHPDERVAWNSTGGQVNHGGVVTFHKLAEKENRVTVQLDWQATGLLEKPGAALGVDNHDLLKDLANLTQCIGSKGTGDGAWRGDVQA